MLRNDEVNAAAHAWERRPDVLRRLEPTTDFLLDEDGRLDDSEGIQNLVDQPASLTGSFFSGTIGPPGTVSLSSSTSV